MPQGEANEVIGQRSPPVTPWGETYSRAGGREVGFVSVLAGGDGSGGASGQQALGRSS